MTPALLGAAELADVGAGGEDPVAAGDHDGARRVGGERRRRLAAAGAARLDRAFTFGLSRREDGDAVAASLEVHQLGVRHGPGR